MAFKRTRLPAAKPAPAEGPAEPLKPAGKPTPVIVKAESAREVVITGDFTGWSPDRVKLIPGPGGVWEGELMLPPGEYQYRLLVDGEWRDHTEAAKRVPNPYGGENCVLTVR